MQTDGSAENSWEKVARLVRHRRESLGMTQEQAAQSTYGLVSTANWRVVERGSPHKYRMGTLMGVAMALGWHADSIAFILAGGEPEVVSEPRRAGTPEEMWKAIQEMQMEIVRLHVSVGELAAVVEALEGKEVKAPTRLRAAAQGGKGRKPADPDSRKRTR